MSNSLSDRMKGYENAYRIYLPKRLPVIVRIDGRAFHTFTKGMQKPFDHILMGCMKLTARRLCKEISGCKLAYTQSDEISLLLTCDDTLSTEPWFGNNLQKLTSLSASLATLYFNDFYRCLLYASRIQPQSRGILTMKNNRRYLVNHDKKVYINLREYVELNKWHEEGDYHKWPKNRNSKARPRLVHYSYDMCINPLPLLTACGRCV